MVGKMQDIVSAAVVIGAAESAGAAKERAAAMPRPETGKSETPSRLEAPAVIFEMDGMVKDDPEDEGQEKVAPMDEEAVGKMTNELNELMSKINCNLQFTYHKEVDVMSVKMIDKTTEEVIKEFPPEDMVESMIKAKEWLGAFLDKNA